jgi:hypothetical protein
MKGGRGNFSCIIYLCMSVLVRTLAEVIIAMKKSAISNFVEKV